MGIALIYPGNLFTVFGAASVHPNGIGDKTYLIK